MSTQGVDDLIQRQTNRLHLARQPDPLDRFIGVVAIARRAPLRRRQHAAPFVEPDRVDRHLSPPSNLTDLHNNTLTLDMTPEFTVIVMTTPATPAPLVCDMTTAPDTPQQRMAEYGRLFAHAHTGSDRTSDAVIWRFTARAGVEAWVRDLADREAACCPFLTYTVTEHDGEVTYQIAGDDDPMIQAILDEIYQLPGRNGDGLPGLLNQLKEAGLDVHATDDGITVMVPAPAIRSEETA